MKYILKYQNPSSAININFQSKTGQFLPQSVLVKKVEKKKTSNPKLSAKPDPNAGNLAADTGTRMLSALKTFGGSAIGNVVKDVGGQKAADAVEKYTLGMIPYTRDEEFKANRTDWNSRAQNSVDAANSYMIGKTIGAVAELPYMKPGINQLKQWGSAALNKLSTKKPVNVSLTTPADLFDLNKIKKPNGGLGNQGATSEGVDDILNSIGIKVKYKGEPSIKEAVEHLKNNPKDAQKYKQFLEKEPIQLTELPDQTYQLQDGHHRATLAYYSGQEHIPAVIKNKGEYTSQAKLSTNLPLFAPSYPPDKSILAVRTNPRVALENFTIGSENAKSFIRSQTVTDQIKHNKLLAERLGKLNSPLPFKQQPALQVKFVNDFSEYVNTKNNAGASIEHIDALFDPGANQVVFKNTVQPKTAFHEILHSFKYGDRPIQDLKAKYLIDPNKLQHLSPELQKYYSSGTEAAVHAAEYGFSQGLTPGAKYPGQQVVMEMLDAFGGPSQGGLRFAKRETPRDYKRIWDAMTGKFFTVPAVTLTGKQLIDK